MVTSNGTGATGRWLPLSGVIFVVLTIVAVAGLGGSTPGSDAPAAEVASFYEEHEARQFIAVFVLAASVPFLMFFGTFLANAFPSRDGHRSVWQLVLVGGSAVAAATWILTAFIHFALADAADQGVSAGALEGLNVLDGNTWVAFNSGLGVMMLGAAGTLLSATTTTAYRWLGWAALVLGIALFIPFADFFALLLTGIWVIVTSIMLTGRRGPASATAAPEVA